MGVFTGPAIQKNFFFECRLADMEEESMTTVAFVTYSYQGIPRRVGPLEKEPAESFAKELARREGASEVVLEEWGLIKATPMVKP